MAVRGKGRAEKKKWSSMKDNKQYGFFSLHWMDKLQQVNITAVCFINLLSSV